MNRFAHLYETEEDGQVLVLRHEKDDRPAITFFFTYPDADGDAIVETSSGFPDTPEGEGMADQAFAQLTRENTLRHVQNIRRKFDEITEES